MLPVSSKRIFSLLRTVFFIIRQTVNCAFLNNRAVFSPVQHIQNPDNS